MLGLYGLRCACSPTVSLVLSFDARPRVSFCRRACVYFYFLVREIFGRDFLDEMKFPLVLLFVWILVLCVGSIPTVS